MPSEKVRSNYDELGHIASRFNAQADLGRQQLQAIQKAMAVLQGGDWIGKGATRFYGEMDASVLPSLKRLCEAFAEGAKITLQVQATMRAAEQESARILDWTGSLDGGGGGGSVRNQPAGGGAGGGSGSGSGGGASGGAGGGSGSGSGGKPAPAKSELDSLGTDKKPPALSATPATVTFPPELSKGMQDAWSKSLPGGKSQEQGGILVRKADGTLEFRPGPAGSSGMFSPNYGDVKTGETLVGVVHTHPYSKAEGGFTNVSFSGGDLASMVFDPDPMQAVQSGTGQFAVIRTQEFQDRIDKLNAAGKQALFDEINDVWDKEFAKDAGKTPLPDRAHNATTAIAKKYGLAYYKGSGDTVARVTP